MSNDWYNPYKYTQLDPAKPIHHGIYSKKDFIDALKKQPLAVGLDWGDALRFYKKGIFTGDCGGSGELNHAVTAVGYGYKHPLEYVIIRNSWGDDWGEEGYICIEIGEEETGGKCNMWSWSSYPLVA